MVHHLLSNASRAVLVAVMAILFGHCHLGCTTTQAAPVVDETAYTTELLACVHDYALRADVDVCRKGVNERFGVSPGAKDGGTG